MGGGPVNRKEASAFAMLVATGISIVAFPIGILIAALLGR